MFGLYTVLMLVFKLTGMSSVSWWLVFAPQLIATIIFGLIVLWIIITDK